MLNRAAKTLFCALCIQAAALPVLQAEPSREGAHFEIGPEISHITYEEPGLMEESGVMYGISGAFTYRAENMLGPIDMVKVEGTAAWGEVDYTSPISGTVDGIEDSMFEVRALLGLDIATGGRAVLTPFIGFGYRQLDDNGGGMISSVGDYGYDREANYYYSPIGIEISSDLDNGWTIGGTIEYDYFWSGTQFSELTDANNDVFTYSDDLRNEQHDGYGLRASVKIAKKLDSFSLAFEPFLRYWKIDNSDFDTIIIDDEGDLYEAGFVEPRNNSTQYGLKVSLLF